MKSISKDTVLRALDDLREACSTAEDEKDEQRLRDLKAEIRKRAIEVDRLMAALADAEEASKLLASRNPALAMALTIRVEDLRAEIKSVCPDQLERKVAALDRKRKMTTLSAEALDSFKMEELENGDD